MTAGNAETPARDLKEKQSEVNLMFICAGKKECSSALRERPQPQHGHPPVKRLRHARLQRLARVIRTWYHPVRVGPRVHGVIDHLTGGQLRVSRGLARSDIMANTAANGPPRRAARSAT